MQMNGCHLKKPLAFRESEISDLNQDADHFADGDDRNDGQHGPLAGHEGNDRHGRAERKRTCIAHEEFRGMDVEPQETK